LCPKKESSAKLLIIPVFDQINKLPHRHDMVQWTSHPLQRLKTRVQFLPWYTVLRENIAMLLCVIDLICNVWVLKKINKIK
jgi:hypothetical protein